MGNQERNASEYLNPDKKTVLIVGGSLGAKTLNETMDANIEELAKKGIQVIWQCGKYYADNLFHKWENNLPEGVWLNPFIFDMDYAYAAADLIVSRAGAISVSELCLVGKPAILVPSPHVAEDHQTKNAMALVEKNACLLVKDSEAKERLFQTICDSLKDDELLQKLSRNIKKLSLPEASKIIVQQISKSLS